MPESETEPVSKYMLGRKDVEEEVIPGRRCPRLGAGPLDDGEPSSRRWLGGEVGCDCSDSDDNFRS